ncbi:hypothetical protein MKX01_029496 [Papaver californicum]|nr:hypothetical protein MKX01_029496 [Papaver californicum]
MATATLKTSCFLRQSKGNEENLFVRFQIQKKSIVSVKSSSTPIMASLSVSPPVIIGLSEKFAKLKKQGKCLIVLDSCGSDIIELGVPYSDPLADGPVIQAAATRSLARGTNFDAILSMLEGVVPKLSCPIALFTYYNPILKRGVGKFMTTIKDVEVHVSSIGVTGTRSSVSLRVESLLRDIKKASGKPVAVGFGILKPKHVKLVAGWGADGVIVGSVMVKILEEANSPEEGLKELEAFTKSLKVALP